MIGHCISFAQRGPESFLTVMPSIDNDLFNRIVVTFMGRRNMPEDVATFLRLVPTANVRPELVIMHLRALKAINPYWDSMLINDSLENQEAMHAVPGQIFASRNVIDDPTIMALDWIAYDNPAQAVDTANIQALPVVLDTQHTNTVSFNHVFLNPRDGDESIAIADPLSGQQRMVEAIRNLGHVMEGETTEEQGQEHPLINPPLNTNRHLVFDLEDDTTEHDLTNIDAWSTIDLWCRHRRLSSSNVSLMNPPRDGNSLFQACISKLKNCSIQLVTTNDARDMRYDLMEFLIDEAENLAIEYEAENLLIVSLIWEDFAMLYASDIEDELHVREIAYNTKIMTLRRYAHWMRIATPDRCVYGNTPELHLIAHKFSVNIAIFEVDPDNLHEYVMNSSIVVDPNNHDNVIYLLKDGNHYQRIITSDGLYFIGDSSTFPPINDIHQHQELPPYVPRILPLPGVQELHCDPSLDFINQQNPLDVTDDNNLPLLWDFPPLIDDDDDDDDIYTVDYYDNEISDLPPLLDDDDNDDDDDIHTFDVSNESPNSRLSSNNVADMDPLNVALMDPPRDVNCLF